MNPRTLTAGLGLLALGGTALAQGPAFNEFYISHSGPDDQEFIELVAPPGYDFTNHFVLMVEGDSESTLGGVIRAWELTGQIVGVDGFFVLGNTAVANLDFDIGPDSVLQNGTETFLLLSTDDPVGMNATQGMDTDIDDDGILELPGNVVIYDLVGVTDGGADDVVHNGAQTLGPFNGIIVTGGIFREGDWPNPWCSANWLDFQDEVNLDQPRTPGAPNAAVCAQLVVLNEVYASHDGTDDQEFVEVAGAAGTLLDGYLILVVEGEGSNAGLLDDVFDLAGLTVPDDSGGGLGYIVAGNTAVANLDLDIGADNIIENGTETVYLVQAADPSAVVAIAGSDVDTDDDGVTELSVLSGTNVNIIDRVALVDAGIFTGEVAYDGAPQVGPDGTFLPAGAFRDGDLGPWCTTAFLDFDDVANASQPRTPGESNAPATCPVEPGVASCFGTGCPCANDDPAAGCANSTGFGGLLDGSGSTSVAADDLVLSATGLPSNNSGLYYMGDTTITPNPFFDGLQCALGTTFRFLGSIQSTLAAGEMTYTGFVADAGGLITAGSTWHFHAWHRDFPGTPCVTGANLTNLYSVTFTP